MTFEDEMAAALTTFVVEGRELLQDMEAALLGLEAGGDTAEVVNEIFRAAHTIKGSSGLFGLDHLVRFTHVMESVLDRLRTHEIAVSSDLVGTLLPCRDHLAELLEGVPSGAVESPEQAAAGEALIAELMPYLTGAQGPDAAPGDPAAQDAPAPDRPDDAATARRLHLSLRFGPDCLRSGMDPLSFISYLSTLGEVQDVTTIADLIPEAALMDPEVCYLDFEVTLRTEAPLASVEGVFEFVRDESAIQILEPDCPAQAYRDLLNSFGEHADRVAEVLVRTGAVGAESLGAVPGAGPEEFVGSAPVAPPVAEASGERRGADRRVADRRTGDRRTEAGAASTTAARREGANIRVDADRLDRLIDVVGELVIAGASAGLRASQTGDESLVGSIGEVMRLVEEVRDSALQLRMVPIGTTLGRFQRVVRDVSADLGKDVDLVITGGETEVDKALVEKIGDPLMHLVRNSLDHGIEPPEVRAARGKPARGTLRLNAFHDSGSIVIEVADDGGGINAEAVLAKAIERGIVEPGSTLTDKEVFDLIFEPGFSTATAVSNLSGRGVGMDVVKQNVAALRGTIDVESTVGAGSTVRIRLPLTLAIIDGFMVGVAGATYIVPLDRVVECVELPVGKNSRDCMDLRGEVLPFIRLRQLFNAFGQRPRRESVVVVEYAGMKVGLVVDSLMGEYQTVIKPLGRLFSHVQGIGGSTIMGNGDIALIIDVPMLIRPYGDRSGSAAAVGVSA
ncbi:MAG: chemotaxis protein CheA [Kineosporiaceae bacterium]|nr:chemotaxis protein CheA [Kineosporiaceae bacterium]